ncbi:hypothetical protein PANT_15c00038 [Moesziomyces antarcticus T-34]|uniref:Transcription regulator Rua1 C-terminal domain-containing protein n=1 Tax=Pseudozyma antarctica (strain T-34) TaxID=1151754 RepID=M9M4L4_PSEA3|nr:hypothetical protein PANT_15c00038 [Moesziomyces antarcticus T-34]
MQRRDSLRAHRYHPDQHPSSWTPSSSSSSTSPSSSTPLYNNNNILPPITFITEFAGRSRNSFASSSNPASCPSSPHSISSRSSGLKEPQSPIDGQPLLGAMRSTMSAAHSSSSSSHRSNPSAMPHEHASASDSYHSAHTHSNTPHHARPVEDGSHLWGDGMKGIWPSLTGAPHNKPRAMAAPAATKGDHLEPARPSDVEAASSIWDIPRETVTMTMGFQGQYEVPSLHSQPTWQQQQQQHQQQQGQQQQPHMPSYSGVAEDGHHAQTDHSPSYSSVPAPSGMAGPTGESRSRVGSDAAALADRHYARRPNYQHGRPLDPPAETSNGAQWWPAESHAVDEASAQSYYGARRLQPPPLPETRSALRPGWSNSGGFEISGYEFPQSSLGKRQYDEETIGASSHGNLADGSDGAARRYSLASNMSFSRPSAPVGNAINSYRPPHADPRRPSLPSDPYNVQQPAPAPQRAGYSSSQQWSPWGGASSHSGVPAGMSASASSPSLPGWRDPAPMRYGIEAGYPTPSGMAGGDKRQQRDRSSSSASAVQQANTLANTPYQITTDIVLRAPPGSKMEDVYYDQHCEMRTGMPDPPASDFEVENEDDRPRRQTDKLRFPGDLYTPRWVRGAGNAREAWCDRCENGNWLQLKNSQYWYDQVHKHGISSVSGLRFTAPTHLKVYADAAGTVEGKCHQCKEWILICTAKRRRNFAAFFKHAHACHSYRKASAVGNGPYVEHNPGGHRNKKGNHSPM